MRARNAAGSEKSCPADDARADLMVDLSAGTVKWHLKNVYGKLNAISREDALAKARALKLIA